MTRFGYFLSSEEHDPREIVRQARLAEEAGFDDLWISDHFHAWLDAPGNSGFVWSMIGAISQACSLPVTTAVTCPLSRTHPAIVAQAAATSALLTQDRFTLGVGTGDAMAAISPAKDRLPGAWHRECAGTSAATSARNAERGHEGTCTASAGAPRLTGVPVPERLLLTDIALSAVAAQAEAG